MTAPAPIPCIPFEGLHPDVAAAIRAKFQRLGYLGEFFQRTAHQPEALAKFVAFTEASTACVASNLAETIALTVATSLGSEYERNQHERLAVRLGNSRAWVQQIERLRPDEPRHMTPAEQAAQQFLLAALGENSPGEPGTADALAQLVDEVGVPEAVGVLFVSARCVAHAFISNSIGLEAPIPSIFEDGFDGT